MLTLLADRVFISGKILTMNSSQPVAEAVATRQDKIIGVGTNREILQLIGEKTRIVNLDGKTMVPGFIDSHIHVLDFGKTMAWLNLTRVNSISELQQILTEHSEKLPKGDWILGRGWNEIRFVEKRFPTASDLDSCSPNNPVVFYHENSLICAVNNVALRQACITKSTEPTADGLIDKDEKTGAPTGILRGSATDLVWREVPPPSDEELKRLTALALAKIVEAGITSVHWIVLSANEISIAKKLDFERRLPVRVFLIVPAALLDKTVDLKLCCDSMLRLGGGLLITDGYLASKTAALSQPYQHGSSRGKLVCSQRELMSSVKKILDSGLQLVVQAMGDKAIEISLNTIQNALKAFSSKNPRYRLEQAAVLNPILIERMKRQDLILSIQPCVIASEFVVWKAKENLGPKRVRWLYPLQTLLDAGLNIAAGSDSPMEPLNPLVGIQTVVAGDFRLEEHISVNEALRMYTIGAAFASQEEHLKGSIEEGKLADLTVLSADPLSVPSKNIAQIAVEMTIVGGKLVFSRTSTTSETVSKNSLETD